MSEKEVSNTSGLCISPSLALVHIRFNIDVTCFATPSNKLFELTNLSRRITALKMRKIMSLLCYCYIVMLFLYQYVMLYVISVVVVKNHI